MSKQLVAVYGTLKRGYGNHRLLETSKFLGTDRIEGFDMYNLYSGGFPGILHSKSVRSVENTIFIEVFEVDEDTFMRLDCLEGYDEDEPTEGLYDREQVMTQYGLAWIYTFNGTPNESDLIVCGNWGGWE